MPTKPHAFSKMILLAAALASLASAFSTAALAQETPPPGAPEPVDLSNSQSQLKAATYANEIQKQQLSRFITGKEFCARFSKITSQQNGFSVTVPVDYSKPEKGTTEIWAYFTSGPFDPKRPTVVFFDGGSGGNSHTWPRILKNYNELHFDQRGIGCSHPESLELYRNPDFYSNENNARDADEIRKALKIDKWSVYGGSYGTVPATIYASLFPAQTIAAVIDGVMYNGDEGYDSDIMGFYLRKMYKTLPQPTQAAMDKYFAGREQLVQLFAITRVLMYRNDAFEVLRKGLLEIFPSPDKIDKERADKAFKIDQFSQTFFGDTIDGVEAFNNQMLNCKNISQKRPIKIPLYGSMFFGLLSYKFNSIDYTVDTTQVCSAIGVPNDPKTLYRATDYPVSVPISYFQGNLDGATFAPGATKHYKKVPKGSKQLLIAVKGGHCPGVGQLMDKDPNNQAAVQAQIEVFENALAGKFVTSEQIKRLNEGQKTVRWVFTSTRGTK